MNGFWIAVLVLAGVAAAAFALLGAASRREASSATQGATLGREALKRDKARRKAAEQAEAAGPPTGKEVELAAAAARSAALEPVGDTAPVAWVPPDPEVLDESRRGFLNRSIIALMGLGVAGFAAGAFTAFLWPTGSSGFAWT